MLRLQQLVLLVFSLLISGCPHLPDYALPHIEIMDSDEEALKHGFTYRTLTIDDFRAPALPKHLAAHTKNFQAHSRIQIRPTKDSEFTMNSSFYYNQTVWSGRMKYIAFEAVMLPEYSWWNPNVSRKKYAYVLQHEQIHFALMELAARQLTQQAQEDIDALFVIDSTPQGVREQLHEKINALIQAKNEEIIKEHTAFDEDTSLYLDPEKQQWWFEKVTNQLVNSH